MAVKQNFEICETLCRPDPFFFLKFNISAVPKSTQYATKYGVKIFKSKTASLNLLVYFQTVQKTTVSTAGAEIVNW